MTGGRTDRPHLVRLGVSMVGSETKKFSERKVGLSGRVSKFPRSSL